VSAIGHRLRQEDLRGWGVGGLLTEQTSFSISASVNVIFRYNANVFLNTTEVYDPVKNEWEELPPMLLKRARVQLVTNGPLIYAIGGSWANVMPRRRQ